MGGQERAKGAWWAAFPSLPSPFSAHLDLQHPAGGRQRWDGGFEEVDLQDVCLKVCSSLYCKQGSTCPQAPAPSQALGARATPLHQLGRRTTAAAAPNTSISPSQPIHSPHLVLL